MYLFRLRQTGWKKKNNGVLKKNPFRSPAEQTPTAMDNKKSMGARADAANHSDTPKSQVVGIETDSSQYEQRKQQPKGQPNNNTQQQPTGKASGSGGSSWFNKLYTIGKWLLITATAIGVILLLWKIKRWFSGRAKSDVAPADTQSPPQQSLGIPPPSSANPSDAVPTSKVNQGLPQAVTDEAEPGVRTAQTPGHKDDYSTYVV